MPAGAMPTMLQPMSGPNMQPILPQRNQMAAFPSFAGMPTLASMFGPGGTGMAGGQPAGNPYSLQNVTGPITADQLAMAMLGPAANQRNPDPAGMIGPYGTPTEDPTFGFGTPGNAALSPQELQQWVNYFNSPGAQAGAIGPGGGAPTMQNQLVQTGSQWQSTMPSLWGMNFAQPGSLAQFGIQTGPNQQATAANINASQFAGQNPQNPYYNLILNQLGQGNVTPTYAMQQVPVPQQAPQPSQFAQVVGGQLIGNLTPEEQKMAMNFPGQYVPDFVNQMNALVQGGTAPQWAETQAMNATMGDYAQQSGQNLNALMRQAGLAQISDRG